MGELLYTCPSCGVGNLFDPKQRPGAITVLLICPKCLNEYRAHVPVNMPEAEKLRKNDNELP